jgi:hypothetical protein
VGKRDSNLARIAEDERRFRQLESGAIRERLHRGYLVKEAQIALRRFLEKREQEEDRFDK